MLNVREAVSPFVSLTLFLECPLENGLELTEGT